MNSRDEAAVAAIRGLEVEYGRHLVQVIYAIQSVGAGVGLLARESGNPVLALLVRTDALGTLDMLAHLVAEEQGWDLDRVRECAERLSKIMKQRMEGERGASLAEMPTAGGMH